LTMPSFDGTTDPLISSAKDWFQSCGKWDFRWGSHSVSFQDRQNSFSEIPSKHTRERSKISIKVKARAIDLHIAMWVLSRFQKYFPSQSHHDKTNATLPTAVQGQTRSCALEE
jgi:hypothetical protein